MKMLLRLSMVALIAAWVAAGARAQVQVQPKPIEVQPLPTQLGKGLAFAGPEMVLLQDKGVRKELRLTKEQIKKVDELAQKHAEALKDLSAKNGLMKIKEVAESSKKTIGETLTKDQAERLDQLVLQAAGTDAFLGDPKTRADLNLTGDQLAKIASAFQEAMKKHFGGTSPKGAKGADVQKTLAEVNRTAMADALKVLTPEQQTKWKAMVGALYDGVLPSVSIFGRGGIGLRGPGQIQPFPRSPQFPPEFWRTDADFR